MISIVKIIYDNYSNRFHKEKTHKILVYEISAKFCGKNEAN